jgi:hypothetical protein
MTVYHGTVERDFKPRFDGGRGYHDYGNGFYTTEDAGAAKEWACQSDAQSAFVYSYELDMSGLSVLNLDESSTLAWVAVLMTHRRSKKIRGAALERCNRMIEKYGVDVSKYDVIRGFRANDSYFQFTTDFVTDTITLETLMKSIIAGELGFQVCIKSEKAYRRLGDCVDVIAISGADYEIYHDRYLAKDAGARVLADNYSNEPQAGKLLSDLLKDDSI